MANYDPMDLRLKDIKLLCPICRIALNAAPLGIPAEPEPVHIRDR